MNSIEKLINENSIYYEHLEYYFSIIKESKINLNENPDISIEACKSLIEGISKYILSTLKNSQRVDLDQMEFKPLVNKMLKNLSKYNSEIDDCNFTSQFLIFTMMLGKIRNDRGDMAHGKLSPKPKISTPELSNLIFKMTEATLYYLLDTFFNIKKLHPVKEKNYDEYMEFNKYLDEEQILPNSLLYSKALFEQDLIAYKEKYSYFIRQPIKD